MSDRAGFFRRGWALAKERVRWEKQWDDINDD